MLFDKSKIYKGDCFEKMKLIPDNSVDFICCDLPYGSTSNKWDIILDFETLWEHYKRIIKNGDNYNCIGFRKFSNRR